MTTPPTDLDLFQTLRTGLLHMSRNDAAIRREVDVRAANAAIVAFDHAADTALVAYHELVTRGVFQRFEDILAEQGAARAEDAACAR